MIENAVNDRPLTQGVGRATVQGAVVGGALGGVGTLVRAARGASIVDDATRTAATAATRISTLDDVVANPSLLRGKAPGQLVEAFENSSNWVTTPLRHGSREGDGIVFREMNARGTDFTGRMIQWHPGGGHHGPNPYWKVSSGNGTVRIQ